MARLSSVTPVDGVGVSHIGNRRGNTSVVDQPGRQLGAYTRWDATLSCERRFGKRDASLSFVVATLTDLEYEVNNNGLAEPRAETGGVSARF